MPPTPHTHSNRRRHGFKRWLRLATAVTALIGTSAHAGELSDRYNALYKHPRMVTREIHNLSEVWEDQSGIDAIGLERGPCFGNCPIYSVVIRRDGRFRYTGEANVPKIGHFTGKVDPGELRNLLAYVNGISFFELADGYAYPMTDAAGTFLMVRKGKQEKIIWNYANSGPTTLWATEQLIDKLLVDATWDPSSK